MSIAASRPGALTLPFQASNRRYELRIGIERSLKRSEFLLLIVGDRVRPNTAKLVKLLQERVNLGFTFGLVEMPIYSAGSSMAGYLVQPRVLLRTEIVTRTVFVASDAEGTVAVRKVEQTQPASSLSEQAFYSSLSTIDPAYPAQFRSLIERLTDLGCETQLLRNYNVYLDDGLGGRLTVLWVTPTGTATVWGTSARDSQLGEPAGHTYMSRVATIVPGGLVRDDLPNPASWNVRVDGKIAIDLHLLIAHQDAWLEAITQLRDKLEILQDKRDGR